MKLTKYLFAVVIVVTISLNFFTNSSTDQYNALEMMNVEALASGEGSGGYICVSPPRELCIFIERDGQIIPLYGYRSAN
ncbi:NVEALA domain-containing protein [Labilibaculum sp. DW002]|uniref:NVEALA domain-containing protein n=1 Tax=Paralabilibaculum antarcticum TaxID=2912572 RepID=A0ABT5VTV8_9BACT|nr:NVEALA domain-containing protein [Labilibaculum sp. DW002]MDE5417928.1 NVEALA domain-containing protein [Labilibaculum sp. DW002]